MNKRILAALLAAVTITGAFAACGNKGGAGGGGAVDLDAEVTVDESGREMVGNMYVTGLPIVKEKETFSLFCDDNGNPEEKIMYPILEEQTNVHVDLMLYPYDIAKEKKNILINSGDYPDAIGGWVMEENEILTSGMKDGLYIQLDGLIDRYAPKMQEILDIQGVRQTMTLPDGHIYTIPYVVKAPVVPYAPYINKEWLDKLGLAMPTTTDEFADVLRAFKTQDPNGNGKADEIPYSADKENLNLGLFAGYWGKPSPNNMLIYENGKLEFTANTEEYKSAMKWLAGLYKEGLIDPEMFTHDRTQWAAKGNSHPRLYGSTMAYNQHDFAAEGLGPYDETEYVTLPVLKAPGVENPKWRRDGYGVSVLKYQLAITDKAKNPATIIRWYDNVYDLDNSIQIKAGLFGKRLEKLGEGDYRYMDEGKLSEAERQQYGWANMYTQSLPNFVPRELVIKDPPGVTRPPDENDTTDKMYEPYLWPEAEPKVWASTEDADRISILYNDLDKYTADKRAAWISGQADVDADWEAYCAQLEVLGASEYVAIKQKAIDALNGSGGSAAE